MSAAKNVDTAARELTATVEIIVNEVMRDILRLQMQGGEAEANYYARACLEEMPVRRIPALVAAHDKLAAAINAASPHVLPIVSLTTGLPA